MTILVTGGRSYHDWPALRKFLDALDSERKITRVIEGGATGADTLARHWASVRGVQCDTYEADWRNWGKLAGGVRNQQMIDLRPDFVVATRGKNGTADCIRRAGLAGIPVIQVP